METNGPGLAGRPAESDHRKSAFRGGHSPGVRLEIISKQLFGGQFGEGHLFSLSFEFAERVPRRVRRPVVWWGGERK